VGTSECVNFSGPKVSDIHDIMLLKAYKKHALTPLILVLLASLVEAQSEPKDSGTLRPAQPPELRLTEPLRWENGCLRIDLKSAEHGILNTTSN
jgi:hypothetical protein